MIIIPNSYFYRHKILLFLRNERYKHDSKLPNPKDWAFTAKEISEKTKINFKIVDEQLDVLYKTQEIETIVFDETNNKFFISTIGLFSVGKKEHLNEGKTLRSQIFNNFSSGFFQIIAGCIAIMTLWFSFTTVNEVNEENKRIESKVLDLEQQLIKLQETPQIQNNDFDSTLTH